MVPSLQTERLILRPLELADAPHGQEIFPHWEIVRQLNKFVPWPYPADGRYSSFMNSALPGVREAMREYVSGRLPSEVWEPG